MTLEELKELQVFMARGTTALCSFEYDEFYDEECYQFTEETSKYEAMLNSLITSEIERLSCSGMPNKFRPFEELQAYIPPYLGVGISDEVMEFLEVQE